MNVTFYNMMTCRNMSTDFMGGCGTAWIGAIILFFVAAVCRKYLGEEMGVAFEFYSSLVLGMVFYFLGMGFTGSSKWALLAGLIGLAIGGFGAPYVFGMESGGDY